MRTIDLPALLEELPKNAVHERQYDKGDVVFRQGARCRGLWFVRRGRVDLRRVTDAGHLVLIHRALAPEAFAEASLFSEIYHCTAAAAHESVLTEVSRQPLLDAMNSRPAFTMKMCAMLAGQVQSNRRLVEILSVRKAEERVYQAVAHGLLDDDIKAFSARIGLTHETVYRALSSLSEQGRMVRTARGQYSLAEKTCSATGTGSLS